MSPARSGAVGRVKKRRLSPKEKQKALSLKVLALQFISEGLKEKDPALSTIREFIKRQKNDSSYDPTPTEVVELRKRIDGERHSIRTKISLVKRKAREAEALRVQDENVPDNGQQEHEVEGEVEREFSVGDFTVSVAEPVPVEEVDALSVISVDTAAGELGDRDEDKDTDFESDLDADEEIEIAEDADEDSLNEWYRQKVVRILQRILRTDHSFEDAPLKPSCEAARYIWYILTWSISKVDLVLQVLLRRSMGLQDDFNRSRALIKKEFGEVMPRRMKSAPGAVLSFNSWAMLKLERQEPIELDCLSPSLFVKLFETIDNWRNALGIEPVDLTRELGVRQSARLANAE